ncbi:hypothetical protein MHYP_G00116810 [Metynnis hypsauchen]
MDCRRHQRWTPRAVSTVSWTSEGPEVTPLTEKLQSPLGGSERPFSHPADQSRSSVCWMREWRHSLVFIKHLQLKQQIQKQSFYTPHRPPHCHSHDHRNSTVEHLENLSQNRLTSDS